MRKNVKQQLALRVLSTAALMAMVSSIATAAFADTYDLNKGSVTVETKEDGATYVTQLDNTQKDGYARNDKDDILHDYQDKTGVTITSYGQQTSNTITVETAKDQTTDVTLQDVHSQQKDRQSGNNAAMTIKGEGDTEIELNGSNILSSGNGHAGLEKADDVSQGSLTIKDDVGDVGSLNASGGDQGAGIGGRKKKTGENDTCQNTSNIKITGGCIKAGALSENYVTNSGAYYNSGAGIGGGGSINGGNANNITITGNADVTAVGGYYAAGIGGAGSPLVEGEDGHWHAEGGDGENITISGNAKVTAEAGYSGGAGIGGGAYAMGKDILITDNANVTAHGGSSSAGIGGGDGYGGSVTISGNATVTAIGDGGGAGIGSGECAGENSPIDERRNTTVIISDNANVTAVGSFGAAAIGNGINYAGPCRHGNVDITITGGTVTAIAGDNGAYRASAIGAGAISPWGDPSKVTVTINGSTGNTVVNASCPGNLTGAIGNGVGKEDLISYDENAKSSLGEDHSVVVKMYTGGSFTTVQSSLKGWTKSLSSYDLGTLYQTVHNRKYMDETIDTSGLKDEDLHDWKLVKRVEPTLEKDGYADYICSIDECGQTKHVPLPKLTPEPSEPDTTDPDVPGGNTPDTPNKPDTPKQPDGTTPAPVTPDAPVQDSTAPADTLAADTTADTVAVPAAAQNVVQDAKPEAAATAAVSAAALPQTGANWLAVVGSALSGMFLLAAGFVLDRKNRRMN